MNKNIVGGALVHIAYKSIVDNLLFTLIIQKLPKSFLEHISVYIFSFLIHSVLFF